jgi:predicted HAD superfamily hydrolase
LLEPRAVTVALDQLIATARDSFDVLSVDVFDTLLLRDSSVQRGRFREVAVSLAAMLRARGVDVDVKTLFALRQRAHHFAYQAVSIERPDGDATLVRISQIQTSLLGLDPSLTPLFIAAEFEVEQRHLAPNRRLIAFLQQLRRDGTRVVAISDMYLSGANIEDLLTRVVGSVPVDKVYASSDFGLTKQSGRLFAAVAAAEGIATAQMLHFGDHESADLAMARAAGCQAVLFRRPNWMLMARRLSALRLVATSAYRT